MNESEGQRPDPILPTGRHPFMRQSDEYGQRIILKMNRPQTLPQFTGQILVRMLPVFEHCGPWEIVRVEEGFMEYMDGEPADPEEWECWADLSTFSFIKTNTRLNGNLNERPDSATKPRRG